jgi:hypothetical protein
MTDQSLSYADVLPLQEPFSGEVVFMAFESGGKQLAVSAADAARVKALLGTDPTGRMVRLSACPDNLHIRVEVVRS